MNELLSQLAFGFSVALKPMNALFAFCGCLVGTLVGVLPGIGPVATIAMLLPLTFYLDPVAGLIMLAGIFYGAQYGGSTTAILLNLPGEASSVMTCLDGHMMAKNGRAGPALTIAALGSFFAGCAVTLLMFVASPSLAKVARSFGAPEYFSLMVLGLVGAVVIARGSVIRALAMVLLGLLFGIVGTDPNSGRLRFTFGITSLMDGIDFVPIAIGLFGMGEIIANLGLPDRTAIVSGRVNLWPTGDDFRRAWPAMLRGTGVGALVGILPGGGATLGAFMAYIVEKKVAKDSSRLGTGVVEGVASPESANNAGAQSSFIPMLSLGIPGNATMAVMMAAMMIHGIQPGPQMITEKPDMFFGLIASMWVGNLMLLIINLPLIRLWVKFLQIPYRFLFIAILVFCTIGVYVVKNNAQDVYIAAGFALLSYFFIRYSCEPAPLVLGFVLGPLMEENLRRSLLMSGGDWLIFVQRPLSLGLLLFALVLILVLVIPVIRRTRRVAFEEEK